METYTQKFKIRLGLFVAGGIAVFFLIVFIIGKQKHLFNPVYKLTSTFYNVSGLQVGNNVRFSGIAVGTVDNIKIINDSSVRVELLIKKDVGRFIKMDSEIAIGSEGLIGDRLIIITQGSTDSPIAKAGQELNSIEPVETDAIIKSLEITAGSLEIITEELAGIMIKINTGKGTLGRIIHDSVIAQNMVQIIDNFKKTSEILDETIDTVKQSTVDLFSSLRKTAGSAEISTQQLGEIMYKINSGNGPITKLIQDSAISVNIDSTIIYLKNSSRGLDENMEALKNTWFLRGYFKKKAKAEEKEAEKQ